MTRDMRPAPPPQTIFACLFCDLPQRRARSTLTETCAREALPRISRKGAKYAKQGPDRERNEGCTILWPLLIEDILMTLRYLAAACQTDLANPSDRDGIRGQVD